MATNWIKENIDERMFAWLHYNDVHGCVLPEGNDVFRRSQFANGSSKEIIAGYDNRILFSDKYIGTFLENLNTLGIRDNSVVILTADHGEQFMEHGRHGHNKSLYEQEVHVPLIIQGKSLPKGIRIRETVGLMDILPTVADISDVELSSDKTDGVSLLPMIDGSNRIRNKGSVCSFFPSVVVEKYDRSSRLTGETPKGRFGVSLATIYLTGESGDVMKYVWSHAGLAWLYDLTTDPGERSNLSRDPKYAELIRTAKTKLEKLIIPYASPESEVIEERLSPLSEEEKNKLRALGYLQ